MSYCISRSAMKNVHDGSMTGDELGRSSVRLWERWYSKFPEHDSGSARDPAQILEESHGCQIQKSEIAEINGMRERELVVVVPDNQRRLCLGYECRQIDALELLSLKKISTFGILPSWDNSRCRVKIRPTCNISILASCLPCRNPRRNRHEQVFEWCARHRGCYAVEQRRCTKGR